MDKESINKMTLREVFDFTKYLPIRDGALEILIEKIVSEIENLNEHVTKEKNKENK